MCFSWIGSYFGAAKKVFLYECDLGLTTCSMSCVALLPFAAPLWPRGIVKCSAETRFRISSEGVDHQFWEYCEFYCCILFSACCTVGKYAISGQSATSEHYGIHSLHEIFGKKYPGELPSLRFWSDGHFTIPWCHWRGFRWVWLNAVSYRWNGVWQMHSV